MGDLCIGMGRFTFTTLVEFVVTRNIIYGMICIGALDTTATNTNKYTCFGNSTPG